jgi:hypothetical protein
MLSVVPNNPGYAIQLPQCPCPAGLACQDGLCYPCRLGEYCPPGSSNPQNILNALPCPAGLLCPLPNSAVACPAGSICPLASFVEFPCDNIFVGTYCPVNSTQPVLCAAGSYCPTPAEQLDCPAGNFCKGKITKGFF